ncbi:MAG: radical SAM protein [Sandaracinaceae bacterium]|nr:radical SAM protein [Sandaracinaceae bacterium]
MQRRQRPYLFYASTRALCSRCLVVCDAKEVIEDGCVYLLKRCLEHGPERVLLSDDAEYWRLCREVFLKEPEQVERYNTRVEHGCPYDCGICPDHEQHGCVCLLEITDHCNLRCPTCFASSGPDRESVRSLEQVRRMLDRIVLNERRPDVVQVSGGEPTTHPELFAILDECRRRPIKHLMLNTNGLRIAREDGFAERLAAYAPGFEIYLQLDGLSDDVHRALRGAALTELKLRALERLDEVGLSTTLVTTLQRGLNDDRVGEILALAARHRAVRGVTFQPIHEAGRNDPAFDPRLHRLPLSAVRRAIYEQSPTFTAADVVPVPCHPDTLAMAYAIRGEGDAYATLTPLTRHVPAELLLGAGKNTILYEGDEALRAEVVRHLFGAFSTGHGPEGASHALRDLLCCLPSIEAAPDLGYERVFRVVIMAFLDRHTLDLRSVRKSCVHIATPDGERMVPFDTYNLLYRGDDQRARLEEIRAQLSGRRRLPTVAAP